MSERKILIDGVEFVRARDAARRVGLVPDYVTRLARGELVAGKLVRGLWFVSLASLRSFITDQERQKEIWRAELARQPPYISVPTKPLASFSGPLKLHPRPAPHWALAAPAFSPKKAGFGERRQVNLR